MPQVKCPNCGLTINLKNRKETDIGLITTAARHRARTFTDLLHISKLSRKTLSLRLKELCDKGIIVKNNGTYMLNGASEFEDKGGKYLERFSTIVHDKRMRTALTLIAFLALSSMSGYALATIVSRPRRQLWQGPTIIGNFTMALEIHDVPDLYAWQTVISFKPDEIKVMEVKAGEFVGIDFPDFVYNIRPDEGTLLLGGTLFGTGSGKSGGGLLATIVFGYYTATYVEPGIVSSKGIFTTVLLNSNRDHIPISESTLTLDIIISS